MFGAAAEVQITFKRGAEVHFVAYVEDQHATLFCCEQAKKYLGWEPKVALREGLSRMVDDFAKRLGVEAPKVPARA